MSQKTPPNLLDIIKRAHLYAVTPPDFVTGDLSNGENVVAISDWNQAQQDIAALLQFYLDMRAVAAFLIPFAPLTVRPDTSKLTPAQCVLLMSMSIDALAQAEAAKQEKPV